jgi:hypothetical protein
MKNNALLVAMLILAPLHLRAAQSDCDTAPPVAQLTQHRSFSRDKKPKNGAHESATLPGGVKLSIEFSGCSDVAQKVFKFTFPKDARATTEIQYWAAKTNQALQTTTFTKAASPLREQLAKFLKKVEQTSVTSICMDDSKPTLDGCSFEHLGLSEFQVNRSGLELATELTWSDNL